MQKNYILFIIDSLNYSHVRESPITLMPFLEKLQEEGLYCNNMYSQAPYTEAAVMNLYCGQDVLQNSGYLFRFKNACSTIFEEMKKAGYITYYNSYQPQCHPSSVRRGIDYLYYNVGYDQEALWSYRILHYSNLFKSGKITSEDIRNLKEIFEDNFKEWLRFVDDLLNKDESTNMIINNAPNYDPTLVKQMVSLEYDSFKKAPEAYIDEILTIGKKHRFFQIPAFVQKGKIQDRRFVKLIRDEMTPLFKRIKKMNYKLNLKNCKGLIHGPLKKLVPFLKHPGKTTCKDFLKSCYLAVNELKDFDLFRRINDDCDFFKNAPSARTHINHYIRWAEQHKNDGAHFACIHIDDIHNPEIFFTYDSENMDLIRSEKCAAQELLDQIPKTYYGSLTHDLSLRYMDNVLRFFYEELDRKGMLDDACIAICADHGFSFSGNPLRDSFVINLYLENYNIPCIFTGTGLEHKLVSHLRTSKDIPATLCALACKKVPDNFTGHSLTEEYDYPVVQIEYCGGGCPDLTRRELKIAVFDKTFFVGTLCSLDEPLTISKVKEIYDLVSDPKQLKNLKNSSYNEEKVNSFLKHIEHRRIQIKETLNLY